jgi:large subunit ribosomal protein L21
MMYAIIESGSRQYKVSPGESVKVERLQAAEGDAIEFKEVLLVCDGERILVGRPLVANAVVTGVLEKEAKAEKIFALKHKRRKNYRRRIGHRQKLSVVKVGEIRVSS